MLNTKQYTLLIITLLLLLSCNSKPSNVLSDESLKTDSLNADSVVLIPVFGHRFTIVGDFDGDGKKEKLTERYISRLDNKETHKYYENVHDYDSLVWLMWRNETFTYLESDNAKIDSVTLGADGFGVLFLRNEGDLDGDGADDISYVVSKGDYTQLNTCFISSYKRGEWIDLYSFQVRNSEIPDLADSVAMSTFSFIKKKATNIIEISFVNEDADTEIKTVDLRKVGETYVSFWNKFKQHVIKKDKAKLADMVSFPLNGDCLWRVFYPKVDDAASDREFERKHFLEAWGTLFTDDIINLFKRIDFSELHPDSDYLGVEILKSNGDVITLSYRFSGDEIILEISKSSKNNEFGGSTIMLLPTKIGDEILLYAIVCAG